MLGIKSRFIIVAVMMLAVSTASTLVAQSARPSLDEVTAIATQAYIYGYPMVDGYKVLHDYSLDPKSPEFKVPVNQLGHIRGVSTPNNKAVIAPNVDTPYTWTWMDLRAEPVVLSLPKFEKERYVSISLFDLYTYIIGYVTPRLHGNTGGDFLVAGPNWKGKVPKGIRGVFRSPTELALALHRTQLLGADDIGNVNQLQDRYRITPLSKYARTASPPSAPPFEPIAGINLRTNPFDPQFFAIMNWMLRYSPVLPEDKKVRERFARIGICGGCDYAPDDVSKAAIVRGMQMGMASMGERAKSVRSSAEIFGSRDYLKDDYLIRAVGAMLGIYGNAAEEYLGVGWPADSEGRTFDGNFKYRVKFVKDGLPPVAAFWSATVYGADRLLYANEIDRYVVNSSMVPRLTRDADGGITLYIQHDNPGEEKSANWIPVPKGPFTLTLRTYLPREGIRAGKWVAPPVIRD